MFQPDKLREFEVELTDVVRRVYPERFQQQFLADYGFDYREFSQGTARKGASKPKPSRTYVRAASRTSSQTYARASPRTYARAFTQRPNLWRYADAIAAFVTDRRLARIAAQLMGVDGVRLYHDQALYKEAGGGHTPWHVDQFYWPLSSHHTITAWIPLQPVSLAMGPVAFASGSHVISVRESASQLAISDESEEVIETLVAGLDVAEQPFELGDVSFHSGWTCHRAGANMTEKTRAVFTIIYMDKDIRMIEPEHANHLADARLWLPGISAGEPAASPLNPILYEHSEGR